MQNGNGSTEQTWGIADGEVEVPETWPNTYPPQGEDAVTPWLPTDPIPNPEPDVPSLTEADPGIYEGDD